MAVGTTAFPTSLDTVVELVEVKNNASSTLSGNVLIGDVTIGVTDIAEFPTTGYGTLTDDLTTPTKTEIISWTGISGSNLTGCTRGTQGTSAAAFSSGNFIEVRPTAGHHEALRGAVIAIETKIGSGSAIAVNKLAALTASRLMVTDASGFSSVLSVTAAEAGYLSGVTSAIQSQLNAKQSAFGDQSANQVYAGPVSGAAAAPAFRALVVADIPDLTGIYSVFGHTHSYQPLDATLTALAAHNTNGLLTQTGADTFTGRTITGTSAKIDVSNGDGVSGNPTLTISATYAGQSSIITLGTVTTGGLGTGAVLGGVTMTLGSDADGDIYYRSSNVLTRLAKGTALQQLRMNAGATAPEWAAAAGGGLTIGTTAITSGTAGRILYETSGNVVGEIAGSSADANGAVQFAATARSSGVAQYFRINTPADTGQTASTESVGAYFGGNGSGSTVTRTWAAGTVALQRENVFVAPTYAAAGATTITTAATVDISSPIVGASTTLTTSTALRLVASAAAHVPLVIQYAAAQTGDAFSVFDSSATKRFSFNGTGSVVFNINAATLYNAAGSIAIGTSSTHRLIVANSTLGITAHRRGSDDTSAQETFRVFREGSTINGVTGANGLTWAARTDSTDQEQGRIDATWTAVANATRTSTLSVSTVTSATSAVVGTFGNGFALRLVAPAATAVALRADSSATPSADIFQLTNNGSNRYTVNSSATATTNTMSDVSGGTQVRGTLTESVTLSTSGTTTDSTIDLPANSIILSVTGRITTTITTATDWRLGDATIADRFSDANATLTSGTTTVGINQWKADRTTAGQGAFQQSTAKVRITTTGTPGAGVIRITIHYITLSAPTS